MRACDVLGRFGGEEFVAVLPGAGQQEARHIAERLRAGTELPGTTYKVPLDGPDQLAYTTGETGEGLFELLPAADAALYRAKKSGRDRVCTLPREPGRPTRCADTPNLEACRNLSIRCMPPAW